MTRKIVLDCDPGHDDAIAMLLAFGSPEIELLAVTTVAGNQTLDKVTHNARVVATVAGMTGVPIAAGMSRPLVRKQIVAAEIHGETGLDGPVLPEPTVPLDPRHAVDLIIETVMSHPADEITLVPVGPLTNIAVAARLEPRIVGRVHEVVLMGGGYSRGNATAAAEFNIFADPESAHIVFDEDWPVTMVGLDLTDQAEGTPDLVERIAAVGTPTAQFVVEIMKFFEESYRRAQGRAAPPLHDPCAVARVIDPAVMRVRPAHVVVELGGTHSVGMTVADFQGRGGAALSTSVATELDRERFRDLVVGAIENIG